MQSNNWAPQHCEALRDYLARGLSYAAAAGAINAKFGTSYTRSAALGRGKRMGLMAPERPQRRKPPAKVKAPKLRKVRQCRAKESVAAVPMPERAEPVKLRCVGISPLLKPLIELEPCDCRYPYGGDKEGEAIAFCGHPKLAGASYCAAHFRLTRGPGTQSERAAFPVLLRLVQAA